MECYPRISSSKDLPDVLPAWYTEEDIDVFAQEFERTGFTGALNYYRAGP